MGQTDLNIFLQSLRGVQPMIVLAYLLVRNAMTIDQLITCTGLSDDSIRAAIKSMAAKNLLFKQIGEHGRVTWVPVGGTFFGNIIQSPLKADSGNNVIDVVVESEERNKLLSTTTTNKVQSPLKADSGLDTDVLLMAALKNAGIKGKKAHSLLTLPWLTLEYIQAHHAQVQTETWDNPAGMMIYRIEGEEPAVEVEPKREKFHERIVDRGKRGVERMSFTWDIDQEIADFIGHEKGCRCSQCRFMLTVGMDKSAVCPVCKYHACVCEESEDQE